MAKENAKLNGVKNVHFETGAAEKIMPRWKEEGIKPDVIVVDPPRKGLELAFIEAACATGPERIVYVSCNQATLARDLVTLQGTRLRGTACATRGYVPDDCAC